MAGWLTRFSRDEFLKERWSYRPGQHVAAVAPTQNGKTTWIKELLKNTDSSWCRVQPTMLVAKPKDPVVANMAEELNYREIRSWPPTKNPFRDRPDGYALWPHHLRDAPPEQNKQHLASSFRPAINECFWKGNSILIADEVYHLCVVLGLSEELTQHWTQGAGMGAGLWSATQKPSGTQQGAIPTFMWNSPTHIFLGRDPDKRNRDRFAAIGGVDPKLVSETVMGLRKYEWLYIHRDGPTMCIVEAY